MGAIATIIGMLIHGVVDTVWYRPEDQHPVVVNGGDCG